MLIKKVVEVGLDIQNCINVYSDADNIKNILAEKFEGRCFRGCFIKSVDKVIRRGECVINQDGEPTFGTIPVVFEVTAVVYAEGEIINGCTVNNKGSNGIIICKTDIADILLNSHKSLESIQNGQIISVRVGMVRYNQGAKKISVNAMPFLPNRVQVMYKITPPSIVKTELFNNVLQRIEFEEAEMTRLKTENIRAWDIFNQMLYAWKEEQKPPEGAKVLNIVKIAQTGLTDNVKYLSRDNRINGSQPLVCGYDAANAANIADAKVYELGYENAILTLLEDYCSHLRTIREMVGIYSTPDLISKHNNLWLIFKKNKF